MKLRNVTPGKLLNRLRVLGDSLQGLDFERVVTSEQMGLDPETVFRCSPSGDSYLKQVFASLNISINDSIIDVGCGKGSAMRVMTSFPFASVDGVELSHEMATIARRNFQILKQTNVSIFETDATRFEDYSKYNFFYFYNPFPESIMRLTIDRILDSVRSAPRTLRLIYNNPVCGEAVLAAGFKVVSEHPDKWGNSIVAYEYR